VGEEGLHCRWWGSRILAAGERTASLVAMGRDPALKAARHAVGGGTQQHLGRKGAVGGGSREASTSGEGRRAWGDRRGHGDAGCGRPQCVLKV
jgi:hypothetical protein